MKKRLALSALLGGLALLWVEFPAFAQMESPNLKAAPPNTQVAAVLHCKARGEFRLTFADGALKTWAEFSVTLKIDGTIKGPPPGMAVTLPSGKVGDRILLVFPSVDDMKRMVQPGC